MIARRAVSLVCLTILAALASGCRPTIHDIDRIADPVAKARFSCQYLLERALALDSQKDADGVLRRRIADFAEPKVTQEAGAVHTVWTTGGIVLRANGSRHSGSCVIRPGEEGRFVEAVTLDGVSLHAGFAM